MRQATCADLARGQLTPQQTRDAQQEPFVDLDRIDLAHITASASKRMPDGRHTPDFGFETPAKPPSPQTTCAQNRISPASQRATQCPVLPQNIRFLRFTSSAFCRRPLHQGAYRARHGRGAGCDGHARYRWRGMSAWTVKPCGSGSPMLGSSSRQSTDTPRLRRWWLTSPAHQEEHGAAVTPLRRECRSDFGVPVLACVRLFRFARKAVGASCTRHSLLPHFRGTRMTQNPGTSCRGNAHVVILMSSRTSDAKRERDPGSITTGPELRRLECQLGAATAAWEGSVASRGRQQSCCLTS